MNNTENLPSIQQNSFSLSMPSQAEFQMLQVIAKNAQDSGLYAGMGQQAKIFMVLLAARELGVSPMLALNGGIWNIQGKIEISARLMNGLIRRAGHSIRVIVSNDQICTLLGKRSDGDFFECSFSLDDANKAGLAGGNVWKKYPADMLYNRCMSRLARRLFSDVIGTAYVEGEIKEKEEVERLDRELPIAECVEITQVDTNLVQDKVDTNLIQNPEPSKEPLISEEHLKELVQGMKLVDEETKKNYLTYMKSTWGASTYEELPQRAFNPTMRAIANNIEMNKRKELVNA